MLALFGAPYLDSILAAYREVEARSRRTAGLTRSPATGLTIAWEH